VADLFVVSSGSGEKRSDLGAQLRRFVFPNDDTWVAQMALKNGILRKIASKEGKSKYVLGQFQKTKNYNYNSLALAFFSFYSFRF